MTVDSASSTPSSRTEAEPLRPSPGPVPTEPLIVAEGLRKAYGPTVAVDNVSFEVRAGEILGFLGPNGAGKSTTIKIVTGSIAPAAGRVTVCGHDVSVAPLEVKRSIGYLPEALPLYPEMQVIEYLQFIAASRGLSGARARDRIDESIELLDLQRMRKRPTGSLSKGYRQRVGLAQAILHDPPVLILDEPTNGLDPHQIIEIRSLISRLSRSKAIVFSTHILQEISAICTRIMIIRDGRLIADGSPEELSQRAGDGAWELVVRGADLSGAPVLPELGLGRMVGREEWADGFLYRFSGDAGTPDVATIATKVASCGGRVEEIRRPRRSLEEVYLTLTERRGVAS
ncbi:MAG: ABC transporter ATP-binding protein [Planctomycetes bacterium]|nr:ABC transporter ATP-binding protein [Planctomycetota bacterium]